MADEAVRYETRTVKCVRGMESRTAARWVQDGWEVVSQKQGRLQSELEIRRPVRKISRRALVIGGGVASVLVVVIVLGATGVFGSASSEKDNRADGIPTTATTASRTPTPSSASASPAETTADATVITAANTSQFAALLQLGEYCDSSIGAFAKDYGGRTVAFDGSILKMNNHDSYTTRYDILLGAGDFSTTKSRGPAFQFEDVNTTFDLHYVADVPDTIGEGTNIAVTAKVVAYNSNQCLLRLEPVQTAIR
ncbi:DUF4839 domain-containing protein [Curtobacterium sp. BRB10]|uniref:DUF4839 domain-containing protein n=1 Tax=Curtobacterium sp. BRB10 TaxID=2962579 RepID=UPI0028823BE6|nr:DUF4839 domain-containing protein [Curtobacterium sp. BRB10]MDT0234442.1 DUF4839 domain-containing protein [Curtobacterium sp. BRB10]